VTQVIYTVGIWIAKAGHEDEFADAWRAMAEATLKEFPSARGTLLRDTENPRRFVSFGPWDSLATIEAWRGSEAFKEGVARMRDLLESFEPGTYSVDAEAGTSP
jgi:heme-degrading monooxygenase HmoA